MRGQARQRVAALEHAFQRRGIFARALGADLRQHAPVDCFVRGGGLEARLDRGGDTVLECAGDVLGLRLIVGEQRVVDLIGQDLGILGQQVAADPGP